MEWGDKHISSSQLDPAVPGPAWGTGKASVEASWAALQPTLRSQGSRTFSESCSHRQGEMHPANPSEVPKVSESGDRERAVWEGLATSFLHLQKGTWTAKARAVQPLRVPQPALVPSEPFLVLRLFGSSNLSAWALKPPPKKIT